MVPDDFSSYFDIFYWPLAGPRLKTTSLPVRSIVTSFSSRLCILRPSLFFCFSFRFSVRTQPYSLTPYSLIN